MSDEDWVARLLGAAERPTMPADVADRLDRTVRQQVTGTGPSTDASPLRVVAAGPAPTSSDAAGSVPAPAVVPPAAGVGTGSTAPLRAGTDDARHLGADGDELSGRSRTQQGTIGSSRKEQRSDDEGERRRRLLTRWLPVAAGVLVLGAAGAAAVNVLDGSDGADSAATSAEEVAAEDVADDVAPRALLATGTEYTTADQELFAQQVRDLVTVAGSGTEGSSTPAPAAAGADAGAEADAAAPVPAAPDPAVARASAASNPLADAAALQECIQTVTDGSDDTAAAVDLALVNGVESTVVVVPDPAGTNLFVYVVGPDCTGIESQFQFFTITP